MTDATSAVQLPAAGSYRIDPSTFAFTTRHMFGLGAVKGSFDPNSGEIIVADPVTTSHVIATTAATSSPPATPGGTNTSSRPTSCTPRPPRHHLPLIRPRPRRCQLAPARHDHRARNTAPIVDTEDRDRFWIAELLIRCFDHGGVCGRPGHPERLGCLGHRTTRIPYRAGDLPPKPPGRATTSRQTEDLIVPDPAPVALFGGLVWTGSTRSGRRFPVPSLRQPAQVRR